MTCDTTVDCLSAATATVNSSGSGSCGPAASSSAPAVSKIVPAPKTLAEQPGPGRTTRKALNNFQRKWYRHYIFPLSCIFLHLQVQFGVWMSFPTKTQCCGGLRSWFCDSVLIFHLHPFFIPCHHISAICLGQRDVCFKGPQERGWNCPEMILGDGVEFFSDFS